MGKISLPAMLVWQLDRLVGQLILVGDHYADPSCPCAYGYKDPSGTYVGENCIPKHLLAVYEYATETSGMSKEENLVEILIEIADEARQIRDIEKAKLCGKNAEQTDIYNWARDHRKSLEPYIYDLHCLIPAKKKGKLQYHTAPAPAPASPQVKISGKCDLDICQVKVKATESYEKTAESLAALPDLVDEVLREYARVRKDISSKTFAIGSTGVTKYEFEYRAVDLTKLVVSHDPYTFEPNTGYPAELQPRMRGRTATKNQVNKIAANLDPDSLLTEFQSLDRGAPIIGEDLVVESGNGRVMALILAAKQYPDKFADYRAALEKKAAQFNIKKKDLDKLDNPILVRVRLSDVDRKTFAQESNQAAMIETSAVENARMDAEKITPAMLYNLEIGESGIEDALRETRNRQFVNLFLAKLPENEQASLVDQKGQVSQVGIRRVVMALFVAAFPGDTGLQLAERFFEAIDVNVRNTFNGIAYALGSLSKMEAMVKAGTRDPDYSIGDDIARAITVFSAVKKTPGMTVEKYMAQIQMLDRELTPFQERILEAINQHSRSGRRIGTILKNYAELVISQPPVEQASLMGDISRPDKAILFDQAVASLDSESIEMHPSLMPAPAPGKSLKVEVCRGIQEAKDTHIHFLELPADPKTGDHPWHQKWIEVYNKTLQYCGCMVPAPAGADPQDWFAEKIDWCNLSTGERKVITGWRPLRDLVAWGMAAGKVQVCKTGMVENAFQVTIKDLDSTKIAQGVILGEKIPTAKRVYTPYRELVFEVMIPEEEPVLTWHSQEVIKAPRAKEGIQESFFAMIPAPAPLEYCTVGDKTAAGSRRYPDGSVKL